MWMTFCEGLKMSLPSQELQTPGRTHVHPSGQARASVHAQPIHTQLEERAVTANPALPVSARWTSDDHPGDACRALGLFEVLVDLLVGEPAGL